MSAELRPLVDADLWQWESHQGDDTFTNPHAQRWIRDSAADFSYHQFSENPDFSGFVFPGYAGFVGAKFPAGARFNGMRALRSACFNYAEFGALADSTQAEFFSEGSFSNTRFMDEARFERCRFYPAEFEPQMDRHANFSDATFKGFANFRGANVASTTELVHTQFEGRALFDDAVFGGLFFLYDTKFKGEVSFHDAMLSPETDFAAASFAAPPTGLRGNWKRKS
jgi:uncharacterized protein YjbI with pentapeptide repeats